MHVDSSLDDSLGLHRSDLGIGDSQTAATMAHHGVELVQGSDDGLACSSTVLPMCLGQQLDVLFLGGNELMQRGIQEADVNMTAAP